MEMPQRKGFALKEVSEVNGSNDDLSLSSSKNEEKTPIEGNENKQNSDESEGRRVEDEEKKMAEENNPILNEDNHLPENEIKHIDQREKKEDQTNENKLLEECNS